MLSLAIKKKTVLLTIIFWMLMILDEAELHPVWTSSPSDPNTVIKNENLNLQWNYDINGTLTYAKFSKIADDQSEKLIALKSSSGGSVNVNDAFKKRFIFNISNNQALVTIVGLQRSDTGTYRLQITNQDLRKIVKDVRIVVLFQPSKTAKRCPSPVTEGQDVKLLCNFTGNPSPSIAWNRVGTRKTLSDSEILLMKEINRSDAGRYECLAWNGVGNNSTEFCTIDVLYPAQITAISINQTVQLGKNISLYCHAIGNPAPTISWTHEKNVESGSVLRFDSARPGERGWYKCTAQNGIGSPATGHTYLDVAERASDSVIVMMTITNEKFDSSLQNKESGRYQSLSKRVIEVIEELFRSDDNYKSVEVLRFGSGSVVVVFNLRFERTVRFDKVIYVLKLAASDGKIGNFTVDPKSIMEPPANTPTRGTQPDTSSGSKWIAVGVSLGAVILIGFCIVICCWRRIKRRCPYLNNSCVSSSTGGQSAGDKRSSQDFYSLSSNRSDGTEGRKEEAVSRDENRGASVTRRKKPVEPLKLQGVRGDDVSGSLLAGDPASPTFPFSDIPTIGQ